MIISYEGEEVDADSLWHKKGELMILDDDDRYVTSAHDEKKFYKVKD